jgi:hypothetical protein
MRRFCSILVSAFLAIALPWLGCGGGEDDTTTMLTKAQFIKRADKICEQTDKTQKAAFKVYAEKHPNARSKGAAEKAALLIGLPPVGAEAKELADLPTPAGDGEKIKAIVEGIEKALKAGEADPSRLFGKGSTFASVNKLAREYGFKACALPL